MKKINTKSNFSQGREKKVEKTNPLQIWILVLVVVQLIMTLGMVLSLGSSSIAGESSKIANIEDKVNAIDNFFKNNVQGYNSGSTTQTPSANNAPSAKIEVSADDDPWEGGENAKVTVIEFSDYQCPFCRKYWTESYPQLKKDYIDTKKIKYVFRDFPLSFHPSAPIAAVAANCVRNQLGNEAYFKFHDIAFTEQNKLGQNTIQFNNDDVLSWVSQVGGVDMTKFDACTKDPAQKAEIDADIAAGAKAGVSGTPSFFVNGKILVGAQPYSIIKAEIEKALAE